MNPREFQRPAPRLRELEIGLGDLELPGLLGLPAQPIGLVLFVHGSGSSRHSWRNVAVAERLMQRGLAVLLFDLLTASESLSRENVFDIELLTRRVLAVTHWAQAREELRDLPLGYFGASTGAAAALMAAAELGTRVAAVVSRGGRPDLAATVLQYVTAPTLLVVGSADEDVLGLNRRAQAMLRSESQVLVVEGATHLFEEPGALAQVAEAAGSWFARAFLKSQRISGASRGLPR